MLCLFITDVPSTHQKAGKQAEKVISGENQKSQEKLLQKSIEKATKVLDLSEDDSRCSGCCHLNPVSYGHPKIFHINGTSETMLSQSNISVRFCANPPVDRLVWELPDGQLLKPGQSHSGVTLQKLYKNATCSDLLLTQSAAGYHIILAKNRIGFDEIRIFVKENRMINTNDGATFQLTSKAASIVQFKCDSVHFSAILSLILMFIWTSSFA